METLRDVFQAIADPTRRDILSLLIALTTVGYRSFHAAIQSPAASHRTE